MANPLAGNVKLPGIGEVPKTAVAVGLLGTGVAIWYYRSKHSSATPTPTPSVLPGSDPYPPDGTVGDPTDLYSTDPATGVTYGDEQYGYGAGIGGGGGGTGGGGGGGGGGSTGGPPFSDNGSWSQYVIAYLTQTGGTGFDPGKVTDAIGLYIAGAKVTPAQENIINDAIAIGGTPPVSGPNNFPPSINVNGSKGGGGGKAHNPVTGLKATPGFTGIDVSWDADPSGNATSYTVTAPGASNSPATVTTTSVRMHNNRPKSKVTITVTANPAKSGVKPASITVTTK